MSRPVKVASIDELKSRKKARKLKMKEPEESVPELPQPQSTEILPIKEKSTGIVVKGGKRKAAEVEDDFDNITVKIPTGSTVISDPSSLNPFIKDLLLEEDDRRLTQIGAVEAMKKSAALNYQAMECSLFMQRQAELMVRKQKDMEKSMGIMRKEIAEMKTSFEKKNQENMELSKELVETKATLKMEKEISDVMIENYKTAFDNVKKENSALVEQIESIALESMLKERNDLMKDFIEGRTGSWEPQKWIQEYEHYISSANEEGVEGKGEEVESRKAEEESKESEMLIGPESEERATEVAEEEVEGQGKEKEDAGRMEIVAAGPVQDVPASDVV